MPRLNFGLGSGGALASLSNLSDSPVAAVVGYCVASISMTIVNKFVVSGEKWNMTFLYLIVQASRPPLQLF
jgi:hypothetical protein